MRYLSTTAILLGAAAVLAPVAPASAQMSGPEGDASGMVGHARSFHSDEGEFWLDSMSDREVVRYTSPRDVRLCLPRADGASAPRATVAPIPLTVTWDQTQTATLYPGNCLFFDARRVSIKPAAELPSGVTIHGRVETSGAQERGQDR